MTRRLATAAPAVVVVLLAVVLTSLPAVAAPVPLGVVASGPVSAAPAGVGPSSGGAARAVARYAATPPSGIRCRTAVSQRTTYACVIGRSVGGRAIVARRQGPAAAPRVLVVNGQMHGEEWPGPRTVALVRGALVPVDASYQIWTITTINPDGKRIGRRRNNHRVDLNRNFPDSWAALRDAGRRAMSEPETRAMVRFLRWVQPDLVISLHGFSESVDTTGGGLRAAWARDFSRISGIGPAARVPCGTARCHGNMTDWYSRVSKVGGVAVTVEMPRSSKVVRRCAVPGRPARATPIQCAAWAALDIAPRLPAAPVRA